MTYVLKIDAEGNIYAGDKKYHTKDIILHSGNQLLDIDREPIDVLRGDTNNNIAGYLSAESFMSKDNKLLRMVNPKGATYSSNGTSQGALKITLPVGYTNGMMKLKVNLFNYAFGESFTVDISGYNYNHSGDPIWKNATAFVLGDPSVDMDLNIRFGDDGTNTIIYIGELDNTWSYLKYAVTEVMVGYLNFDEDTWYSGWSCDLESSSFSNISLTVKANKVGRTIDDYKIWHEGNDGANSGLDADVFQGHKPNVFMNNLGTAVSTQSTSGYIQAGRGSGGVSLTHNDGYGNANVTFNHSGGKPEQDGNAGRITVNTDEPNAASMIFQIGSNVTKDTSVGLSNILTLTEDISTLYSNLITTGNINLNNVGQRIEFNGGSGELAYIEHGGSSGQIKIGSDDRISFYETDSDVEAVYISTNNKTITAPGGFIGTATNADKLDGVDSTQFLRSDVEDTYTPMFLNLNHTQASIVMDSKVGSDGRGVRRITCNDGAGNFNIRDNAYSDGGVIKHVMDNSGVTNITSNTESTEGKLMLSVAGVGSKDDVVNWDNSLSLLTDKLVTDKQMNIGAGLKLNANGGNVTNGSDILMTASGVISTEQNMYFNIDSNNDESADYFRWNKNADNDAGDILMQLNESGLLDLRGDLNINGNSLIYSNAGPNNIDHIWHDDDINAFNFISDAPNKSNGNSFLKAGTLLLSGSNSNQNSEKALKIYGDSYLSTTINDRISSHDANTIDYNISGSTDLTSDARYNGLYIDLNSSFTGGDTNNEHRINGILTSMNISGDSDLINGMANHVYALNNSGTVSEITGIYNLIGSKTSDTGKVVNLIGSKNYAYLGGSGSKVDNIYGSKNYAYSIPNADGDIKNLIAINAEAEINGTGNVENIKGIQSYIDNNTGGVITSNAYLFKGDYSGPLPTNSWGIYINQDVPNYFRGKLHVGNDIRVDGSFTTDIRIDKSDASIILNDNVGDPSDQSVRIRSNAIDNELTNLGSALILESGPDSQANTPSGGYKFGVVVNGPLQTNQYLQTSTVVKSDTYMSNTGNGIIINVGESNDKVSDQSTLTEFLHINAEQGISVNTPDRAHSNWEDGYTVKTAILRGDVLDLNNSIVVRRDDASTEQFLKIEEDSTYDTAPSITSFSSVDNAKTIIYDSRTNTALDDVTGGTLGHIFKINASDKFRVFDNKTEIFTDLIVTQDVNIDGGLDVTNVITASKFISNNSVATSTTDGAIRLNGTSGSITLDTDGGKRLSWNDGAGNFQLRSGNYFNGGEKYIGDNGAVKIGLGSDGGNGVVELRVAALGSDGDAVNWVSNLIMDINGLKYNGADVYTTNDDIIAVSADKLTTPRTIALSGDVTGSTNFDGSSNVTIGVTVKDDSHNHVIGNVDGLQSALDKCIKDNGTSAISDMDAIGPESKKYRWNNGTTGRPAEAQSNEYGTLLNLDYDGDQSSQLAWDMFRSNLYARTLNATEGTSSTWYKFWHEGNDGAGSGLDAGLFQGHGLNTFMNNLGTAINTQSTSGWIQAGRGNGGVSLTHNDGSGHANVTFNHAGGKPEQDGNAGRITVNTDSTSNVSMIFQIGGNVTKDTSVGLSTILTLAEGTSTLNDNLSVNGSVTATGGFTGTATNADKLDGLNSTQFLRSDTSDTMDGNLYLNGSVVTDKIKNRTGTQLVLNAGESDGKVTGQTAESVYVNAESGLVISTPDRDHSNWETDYTVDTTVIRGEAIYINGNKVWHAGNDGAGSGLNADMLDGHNSSIPSNANTIALRNGSGDIVTRLFRSEYNTQTSAPASSADICFRNDSSSDNYMRFMSSDAFKTYCDNIGVSVDGHTHTFASLTSKPTTLQGYGIAPEEIPGDVDLDTKTTTALYSQSKNAETSLDLHYPVANAGLLEVFAYAAMIHQRYWVYNSNDIYYRAKYSDNDWLDWTKATNADDKVNDSNKLDGLDSTQFLRSDTSDTMTGNLAVSGSVTSAKFISNNSVATSTTDGAIRLNGTSGSITLDNNGSKRLSWNDGGGNFQLRSGNYFNGSEKYIGDNGASKIGLSSDGTDGKIELKVAAKGTDGDTISWVSNLTMDINGLKYNGGDVYTTNDDIIAVSADKLTTSRTITLGGDLSGSINFDGSSNVSSSISVKDDSHNHVIGNVDGLQSALDKCIKDNGTSAISDMDAIGPESKKYRWNNSTTGRPAEAQSNEYGTLLNLDYDGDQSSQLAWDMFRSNLYARTLNATEGTSSTWYKFWHNGNDGAGSGLDADVLQGHGPITFMNNLGTAVGTQSTTGYVQAGRGNGGVALTHNDGYGHANITFNHAAGIPEQDGNAGRITVNTDATSGVSMVFQLGNGVTKDTAAKLSTILTLVEGTSTLNNDLSVNGSVTATGGFTGTATNADKLDGLNSTQFLRSDTSDTIYGNLSVSGAIVTDKIKNRTGTQLILNAGESDGKVTSQTGEKVYVNAESGLEISTPDRAHANWEDGYIVNTAILRGDVLDLNNSIVVRRDDSPTSQFLKIEEDGAYNTAPSLTSFSAVDNAKYIIYDSRTNEALDAVTAGTLGHIFKVNAVDKFRVFDTRTDVFTDLIANQNVDINKDLKSGTLRYQHSYNLAAGTDLDTIDGINVPSGFYDIDATNSDNTPSANWIYLEVQRHTNQNGYCKQIATELINSTGHYANQWIRLQSGGTWGPWKTIYNADNIPTWNQNTTGNAATATLASKVHVNTSSSTGHYGMLWHSGDTIYANAGFYIQPSTNNLTTNGSFTINGSIDSGATDYGYYQSDGTNMILKGDSQGRSAIFFQSEKDGTNINHGSDYGFIQYHAQGFNGTSGENATLVIGVANDATDTLVLQANSNTGVKIGYRNSASGTGLSLGTVWHSGNDGSGSGLDADKLDGLQGSQFLRSDTSDTMTGNLNVTGTITAAKFISNNSVATSTTDGAIILNGETGSITLDDDGGKRLSWNDGGGNFQLRSGNYFNGGEKYIGDNGAVKIGLGSDGGNGVVELRAAAKGTDGDTISWDSNLIMDINGLKYNGTDVSLNGHTHTFASLTSKPTTLQGYGIAPEEIPGDVDLDTKTTTALYSQSKNAETSLDLHYPVALAGLLEVFAYSVMVHQRYWVYNSNDVYYRAKYNDGWTAWTKATNADDKVNDSNKLDGLDSTQFLRSDTSDTMNGNLYLNGSVVTDKIKNRTGTQLVLNAGESDGKVTSQTGEKVYVNAESGLEISTPDRAHANWDTDYTVDKTVIRGEAIYINDNKVWHAGNDGAGSGLDADAFQGHGTPTFMNSLGTAVGTQSTTGWIQAGRGNGGVALTHNDGYGNANVTFNHAAGKPEQDGNAGRISVNTDATSNVSMVFQLGNGVTKDTAVGLSAILNLKESGSTLYSDLTVNGTLTESSDKRVKENIKTIENSLDKVSKIRGVSFNKIKTPDKQEIGFIAQEVEEVVPELVDTDEDGMKSVSYARTVALLVEAMKEQQNTINDLKTEIDLLKNK